jgi:hypothetical protein
MRPALRSRLTIDEEVTMKRIIPIITAATLSVLMVGAVPTGAGASGSPRCPLPKFGPGSNYHPTIHPADFSAKITNPWYPLRPGTTYVYTGYDGKQRITDILAVSRKTKVIDGVTNRIINDRVLRGGRVRERTTDYYSQDRCGNVWYFGEDTAELDRHGNVTTTDGSFHSGVDGAEPGVFMQAHPQIDRKFRQEWYQGQAEDVYKVLSKGGNRTVPYGSFTNVLRTLETNALEPGVHDNKYYVRGIGTVEEVTVKGPREILKLVDVLH